MSHLIKERFEIKNRVCESEFGYVFLAKDKLTGKVSLIKKSIFYIGESVVVKIALGSRRQNLLLYESKVYKILAGGKGISSARWFGEDVKYKALILDVLGKRINDLFNCCNKIFTPNTVLRLGEQMIARVEYMHNKN